MKCIYLQFFAISLVTKSEGGGREPGHGAPTFFGDRSQLYPGPYPGYKPTSN